MPPDSPCLKAENLSVNVEASNGQAHRQVLEGVSLELCAGELVAVTGPSGSGKSTLLGALARMIPIQSGSLCLNGTPAYEIQAETWRKSVALVMQKPVMLNASVRENLLTPWRLRSFREDLGSVPTEEGLIASLESLGLEPELLNQNASGLSGGEAARVSLLRSSLTRPLFLLLDEPSASLDEESMALLYEYISGLSKEGIGVLVVRHDRMNISFTRTLGIVNGHMEEAR